jgi:hypothetical protein
MPEMDTSSSDWNRVKLMSMRDHCVFNQSWIRAPHVHGHVKGSDRPSRMDGGRREQGAALLQLELNAAGTYRCAWAEDGPMAIVLSVECMTGPSGWGIWHHSSVHYSTINYIL